MCETKTTSDFLSLLDEAQEFLLNRFASSETIPSMIEKLEKVHNEWVMETTDDSLELVLSIDKTKLFITSLLKTRYEDWEKVKSTREELERYLKGNTWKYYNNYYNNLKILHEYGPEQQIDVEQLKKLEHHIHDIDFNYHIIGEFQGLCSYFPTYEIVHFITQWFMVKKNLKTLQLQLDGDFETVERLAADIKMNLDRIDREIGKLIDTSKDWYIEDGLQNTKERIEELENHDNFHRIIVDSALIEDLRSGLKNCEELFARKMEFPKKEEEAKLGELENTDLNDSKNLRNEMMEHFASQSQHMENRISKTNEKMESMNRKLAHFNSSFNEKFNSLEDQFNSTQLDKKIKAMSTQKNRGEDLNQFLTNIGDKFNEQQVEMKLRAEWLDRKMEKIMEMMTRTAATVGSAGPGTIGTSQNFSPQNANIIEPSASQSNPIDDAERFPNRAKTVDVPNSEDDELQKMEDQFRKDLAEQTRVYEMKLRIAQERRREMNVRIEHNQ
ncbi:hypothetical protein CAEBREN_20550 [Caenorhabditis brenneri]|uniref:Uncharacterized protein n=1 Tax=Caenorhabditis brenneri TaxID=135651 RepID=G0MA51_CAEBE|nr:hypothetical protein CAEBREN_20550 [Caenorhabditis brenneri]